MALREAYADTLHQTGKAVVVTGLALSASVATWVMSGLQFQIDMGILPTIMFLANAVAALSSNSVVLAGSDGTLLQIHEESTTGNLLRSKSVDRDQVLAAVQLTPGAGMLIAGNKGVGSPKWFGAQA